MTGAGRLRSVARAAASVVALAGAVPFVLGPAAALDLEAPAPAAALELSPAAPARPDEPRRGNPLWAIPLDRLSATRERPIFAPSRRPPPRNEDAAGAPVTPEPEPAPSEPAAVAPPRLELVGTISGPDAGFALFLDTASRKTVRLRIGDEHEGWVLQAVAPREVTLGNGGATVTLALPARAAEPRPAPGDEPE